VVRDGSAVAALASIVAGEQAGLAVVRAELAVQVATVAGAPAGLLVLGAAAVRAVSGVAGRGGLQALAAFAERAGFAAAV